jgi:hypothetical protein
VILILFPDKASHQALEDCRSSLKRAVSTADECVKQSTIYFLQNGFESIKQANSKKFSKELHGLLVAYYRQKKEVIKNKQKKLIAGQI